MILKIFHSRITESMNDLQVDASLLSTSDDSESFLI